MKLRLLSVLLAASALGACAQPYYMRPGDLAPLTARVGGAQRDAIWQRAIDVLLDEGYVPQVLNDHASYISAKQRDDVEVGALAGTMAIVTISPEGVLRVEVSGHGVYGSGDELLRDVKAVQARLLKEILAPGAAPAPDAPPSAAAAPTF